MRQDSNTAQRDWILVDKQSGFITRGLSREEIGWVLNDAPPALIEAVIALKLCYETPTMLVVGEWRRNGHPKTTP